MIRCIEAQYRIQEFHGSRPEQKLQSAGLLRQVLLSPQGFFAYYKTSVAKTDPIRFCQPTHFIPGKRIERPQRGGKHSGDRCTAEDSKSFLLRRGLQLFDYPFRCSNHTLQSLSSFRLRIYVKQRSRVAKSIYRSQISIGKLSGSRKNVKDLFVASSTRMGGTNDGSMTNAMKHA
jgi:hypothetical protein